jgi:hypothetical protein
VDLAVEEMEAEQLTVVAEAAEERDERVKALTFSPQDVRLNPEPNPIPNPIPNPNPNSICYPQNDFNPNPNPFPNLIRRAHSNPNLDPNLDPNFDPNPNPNPNPIPNSIPNPGSFGPSRMYTWSL